MAIAEALLQPVEVPLGLLLALSGYHRAFKLLGKERDRRRRGKEKRDEHTRP